MEKEIIGKYLIKKATLENGLKFTNPFNSVSPEDFLTGLNQSPNDWQNKQEL